MSAASIGRFERARVEHIAVGDGAHLGGFNGDDIYRFSVHLEKFKLVSIATAVNMDNRTHISR